MSNVADEAIKRICAEIVFANGAIQIDIRKDGILIDEENVLLTELNKDKEFGFQNLQDNARFYYSLERIMFSPTFRNIYKKLKEENNLTYKRFKEVLVEDIENVKKQRINLYDLYFPINIKTENKIAKFNTNGIEIDFIKDNNIVNQVSTNEQVKQELLTNKHFSFNKVSLCKISLKGRNNAYAVEKAEKIYEFILGVIGFYETYGSYPRTLMGAPKPISKLNKYYIFVFQNKKYSNFLFYKTKDEGIQVADLKKEQVKAINYVIKRVIKSKQKILIFKLFTAYLRGLIDSNVDYSFLSFWRIVELGIQKEPNQRHIEIIDILKSLILELKHRTKYKMERFYKLRNDFVHKGIADINQYDRNGIKSFAEMIIEVYLNTLYKYSAEETKLFYYYVKRKNNINQHLKMAKKISSLIKLAKKR